MKQNNRKWMAILLAFTMVFVLASCSGTSQTGAGSPLSESAAPGSAPAASAAGDGLSSAENSLEEIMQSIEPLENPVKLRIGIGAGILHDFPAYLAEKLGLLEHAGIDANMLYFGNGPLMVEALTAGELDVAGYGIGGILGGSVTDVAKIVHIRMEEAVVQKYFVKADSAIAQFGLNPETGMYGNKETWAGKEVYVPPGTTLQYLLGAALEKMDMTMADIKPVFMDAKNVNTALYANQGDAWALWNMFGYAGELQDDYVEAFNGTTAGISLSAASVVRTEALNNPDLAAAAKKWLECQLAVIDWMQASEENMNISVDYFYEWTQEEGIMAEKEDLYRYMNDASFFNRNECLDLMTSADDEGVMTAMGMILNAMDFFVGEGNYRESDKAKITEEDFYVDFIKELQ